MENDIKKSAEIIHNAGILLYPTDTIWGLGCDATNETAIEKINVLKQRPQTKNYIILVNSLAMLKVYVTSIPNCALQLINSAQKPLTIIYNDVQNLPLSAIAADKTAAIRIVNHPFCNALINMLQKPIISTSANISGQASPMLFNDISDAIKNNVDYIVDAKYDVNQSSVPSTIIKLMDENNYTIIRP